MSYTPFNPTIGKIPFNNDDVWEDSFLLNDTTNNVLKSVYGGNDIGLKLDFANRVHKLGDFSNFGGTNNGINIEVDDINQTITTKYFNTSPQGLKIDIANQSCYLGDWDYGGSSGANLFVDGGNNVIKTRTNGTIDIGLSLDFSRGIYNLGSPTSDIYIDSTTIHAQIGGTASPFGFSAQNEVLGNRDIILGDYRTSYNGTYFYLNDSDETMRFKALTEILFFTNQLTFVGSVTTTTSSSVSGQHLQVRINGVDYVIELKNP